MAGGFVHALQTGKQRVLSWLCGVSETRPWGRVPHLHRLNDTNYFYEPTIMRDDKVR